MGFSSVFKTLRNAGGKKEKAPIVAPVATMVTTILGVPLVSYPTIPTIARKCLDYLEADSIVRLENFSLSTPSVSEVQRVIKQFEETDPESVNLASESPETVCGVLRKWLRSLPDPLLSFEYYDAWMAIQQTSQVDDQISEIQNLLFQLHPTHYLVVQRVLRFLFKLVLNGSVNRLNSNLLGSNWQPSLIWSPNHAASLDAIRIGPDGGVTGSIVTIMIHNYDKIFLEDASLSAPPDWDTSDSQVPTIEPQTLNSNPSTISTNEQQYAYQQSPTQSIPIHSSTPPQPSGFPSQQSPSGITPVTIPQYTYPQQGTTSMPVTPITPLMTPSGPPPSTLNRSFSGSTKAGNGSSFPTLNRTSSSNSIDSHGSDGSGSYQQPRTKQLVVVNGYTQGTALCDFIDMTDGMLQFFKNETLYITHKHDDGWWEGWKRGRRGFFPATYVVEMTI